MVGQLIDARSPNSILAIVMMVVALLLVAAAMASGNPHPLIAAILPFTISVAIWMARYPHALVMAEIDGLTLLKSNAKIPYDQVTAITVGGARFPSDANSLPDRSLEIHHDGGCLVLPAKINVSAVELHRYLCSRLPSRPARSPHPLLANYFAEQQAKFGPDKVRVIHTRELFPFSWPRRRNRWACGAILLTGVAWIVIAIVGGSYVNDADSFEGWIAFGSLAAVGAFIAYFALRSDRGNVADSEVARNPNACIVLGPVGFAMVQGDMQGAVRWDEITQVNARLSQLLRTSRSRGLQVRVRGGEIMILDIYEKSPQELELLIRKNLDQPPGRNT